MQHPTPNKTHPAQTPCLQLEEFRNTDLTSLAEKVYALTCRTDFSAPGYCLLTVKAPTNSASFRQLLIDLKNAMSAIHQSKGGQPLAYLSAGRFDQKRTTRFHLDGGPEECFLMLGYEPSVISSRLAIADYAHCAFDLGISPKEFLDRHNPMFQSGRALLQSYTHELSCFSANQHQILCINNSSAAYGTTETQWQGVLHTATITGKAKDAPRIINSTLIAPWEPGNTEVVSQEELSHFVHQIKGK